MASHRKPRPPRRPGAALRARTLTTVAVSFTALAPAALTPSAHAEPGRSADQVRAQVDELYREAEQATQQYDGTKEQVDALQREVNQLQDELARKTDAAEATRARLGAVAAEQYRSGGLSSALQLALADDPQTFLERSARLGQAGSVEQSALRQYGQQRASLDAQAATARARLAELAERQQQLAAEKAAVQQRLVQAQALLARLSEADRTGLDAGGGARTSRGDGRDPLGGLAGALPEVPASGRAAVAIAFATAQLGKPYVWGATGPDSYDCSGLVQAAWRSAGVSLPRTTYEQIGAAPRITRDRLQPGDLVFFFSGVSHVGLYTGNGRMIHAPHPGAPVRYESVDVMPFAGAVRPG